MAVKVRQNARKNKYTHPKLDITMEDVPNSRMLAWPIRMLDMCSASNGACGVVVPEEKMVKDRSKKPIWWIRTVETAHNEQFELDWRDVKTQRPIISRVCPSYRCPFIPTFAG